MFAPTPSPSVAPSPPSSWMTIARPQSARAALESAKAQVSAARAAIEAARTSIIQAQTRVEAAQATERRILADIDDSELKAPAMAAFSIASLSRAKSSAAGGRVLNMVDLADVYMTFFCPPNRQVCWRSAAKRAWSLMPRRIW